MVFFLGFIGIFCLVVFSRRPSISTFAFASANGCANEFPYTRLLPSSNIGIPASGQKTANEETAPPRQQNRFRRGDAGQTPPKPPEADDLASRPEYRELAPSCCGRSLHKAFWRPRLPTATISARPEAASLEVHLRAIPGSPSSTTQGTSSTAAVAVAPSFPTSSMSQRRGLQSASTSHGDGVLTEASRRQNWKNTAAKIRAANRPRDDMLADRDHPMHSVTTPRVPDDLVCGAPRARARRSPRASSARAPAPELGA